MSILTNLKSLSFSKDFSIERFGEAAPQARFFWDFACKIIDFTKKIDQIHVQNRQNFLGAFGAEVLNKGGTY